MSVALTERQKALYQIIAKIAAAGGQTPSNIDLAKMLKAAGHSPYARATGVAPRSGDTVGHEIKCLVAAGVMVIIGSARYRMFELATTGERTKRREFTCPGTTAVAAASAHLGWPLITEISSVSYDEAVERREFANHEMRTKPRQIQQVRPVYGAHSLTGCSADMAASS